MLRDVATSLGWIPAEIHHVAGVRITYRRQPAGATQRVERAIGLDTAKGGTRRGTRPTAFTTPHPKQSVLRRDVLTLSSFIACWRSPCHPCRYIETHPLPKGFLPKVGKSPAFAYLYPQEDVALMGDCRIPLAVRILFGTLAREGPRASEALDLAWRDVDLERGVLTLDKNKTNDARAWALDAGVVRNRGS